MSGVPPLAWWVDIGVLLALLYIGWRGWATALTWTLPATVRVNAAGAGTIPWLLALLHAICHLAN